jgi:Ca-activated chloride channel homolog
VRATGFRTPDGTGGPGSGPAARLLAEPTLADVDAALRTWSAVSIDMRMIAAIDVSGSMLQREAGGRTRIELAQGATDTALKIFPPRSQVGLWEFSTNKGGPGQAYKQLVPLGQLDATRGAVSQRQALLNANASLDTQVGGDTGLYDTILAAYRAVKASWDPHRVNSVVVLTDGRNDNPSGLSLQELMTQLQAEADPARPIPVIAIGMGPDADAATLDTIARSTGGHSYLARDPRDIEKVFVEALMQRSCRPGC